MPSAEHVRNVYEAYTAALSTGDADAAVALFAPDAVVRDPRDGTPLEGADQIRAFFAGAADVLESIVVTGAVRITADGTHAAAAMEAVVSFGDERKIIDTLDVMTFDDQGLITSMDAYNGPTNIRDA